MLIEILAHHSVALVIWLALLRPAVLAAEPGIVQSVEVRGSRTPVALETHGGDPFDAARIERDVKRLWAAGRFQDIRVETSDASNGMHVVFRVVERPRVWLREVRFEPENPGLRLKHDATTEIDMARAWEMASDARDQLRAQGYTDPKVRPRLLPVNADHADLILEVETGKLMKVGGIGFSGDTGVNPKELRKAIRATHIRTLIPGVPGLWSGWRLLPAFSENALQVDLAGMRSFYLARGYFDSRIGLAGAQSDGSKTSVNFSVEAGPHYQADFVRLIGAQGPDRVPYEDLCGTLLGERREAEKQGVLDFSARLSVENADAPGKVNLSAAIERGPAYRIGRIEVRGNHSFSDAAVRRNVLLDEGDIFDRMRLRRTLVRLNHSGWFEPVSESDVAVSTNPEQHSTDLVFSFRQVKHRRWSLSGPVGPMSVGGPLHFSIATRLPGWGRGLLELSTYSLSFNVLGFSRALAWMTILSNRRVFPFLALERPLLPSQPWTSGFSLAPQLGWQGLVGSYALMHAQSPLTNMMVTERALTPPLNVPVNRGEETLGELVCRPPKTKLDVVRQGVGTAANILMSFRPF